MLGSAAVGKSSIISRLVSNSFSAIYEPSYEISNYTMLFNLNEEDVKDRTYVELMIEDVFGFNNPILQIPESFLKNARLKDKRQKMVNEFQDILFTSLKKRIQMSEENNKKKAQKIHKTEEKNKKNEIYEKVFNNDPAIERIGFVIVFDISEHSTYDDAKWILEKLHSVEKTNNIFYEKCMLINKIDKALDKRKVKNIFAELETLKKKYKCDYYKVSALTSEGVGEAFRKFLSKIHQKKIDEKQNEGVDDVEDLELEEEDINWQDKLQSCSNRMFCGNNIFACARRQDEEV